MRPLIETTVAPFHVCDTGTAPLGKHVTATFCAILVLDARTHRTYVGGEFPAVIDATQPALLVAPEKQRGTAMWTIFVEEPNSAVAVAKRDEILAQQPDPHPPPHPPRPPPPPPNPRSTIPP